MNFKSKYRTRTNIELIKCEGLSHN